MNRRQTSKMETRQIIVSAAKTLLMKNNVEQCTMRNIAKEAGVSAASIVVHFENKHALLEAVLGEYIERTTDKAIATIPLKSDLTEKLVHVWQAMYTFYDSNRNLYRALIRSTAFEPEENTPFLTKHTETFLNFLQELIDSEKANGRMILSVKSDVLAMSLFSLYFGTLILFYRNPAMSAQEATTFVSAMTTQTLTGLTIKLKNN